MQHGMQRHTKTKGHYTYEYKTESCIKCRSEKRITINWTRGAYIEKIDI